MSSSSDNNSSYTQILKSSAIVGGAQGIDIIIRMVRVKLVAMLLGPSGVGLIGLYQSIIELAGKLSGLGVRSSAVRQVAEANSSSDPMRLGQTVMVLRRICWVTGLIGWILMILLSKPLSLWIFGSSERTWALVFLGAVLLFENISGGQTAFVQGMRRIKDIARIMIFSAIGGTVISVLLYAFLGERGIVAAFLASAIITLISSWWFSHRIEAPKITMKWIEIIKESRSLLSLGLAFMWSGILGAGVAFAARGLIVRGFGIEASGIYQAAWGISGLFAGFILSAMGQDFYPRLTAAANQNESVNRLVNEQTEVGILLALPSLLATLAFSDLVIQVFYTSKFSSAAIMLPWFVIGIFGRVISWPSGFIQLAKGKSTVFATTETTAHALHLFFIWIGLNFIGILGVAVAFALLYFCHTVISLLVASWLSGFRWSRNVIKLVVFSVLTIVAQIGILQLRSRLMTNIISIFLILVCGTYCLRQLIVRLGKDHHISKLVSAIPLFGRFFIK